jgi:hypothetical protein
VRVGEVSMERTAKAGYAVFGFLRRAKVALGGAEDRSPRNKCGSRDQKVAAGCILNRTRESKMEIPANLRRDCL